MSITITDEEAREIYEEIFKDGDSTFDEFLEKDTGLKESDYLNNTKEGMKIDRLYEMNTNIGDDDLGPNEKATNGSKDVKNLFRRNRIKRIKFCRHKR